MHIKWHTITLESFSAGSHEIKHKLNLRPRNSSYLKGEMKTCSERVLITLFIITPNCK